MTSRILEIELPFGQDMPGLNCPMCGTPIHGKDTNPSCQHILFTYLDAAGGFMYVKPDLSEIVERFVNDDDDDPEDIIKRLMKKIRRKSSLCLAVTGSGMANGPVSYTIFVGIDFADDKAKNKRSSNKKKK